MASTLSQKPSHERLSEIELSFHNTSRNKLVWFYHLLVTEFVEDLDKVQKVADILKNWEKDYDLPRLQQIDHCLSGHPLLQMAFNAMLNSDVTCISLEVPVETDEDSDIFMRLHKFPTYYNRNMDLDKEALTQQFLTKEVEMKAINDGRYPEVLHVMSLYENKHSQYAFNSKRFRTYCQKLVTFCGFSQRWDELLKYMVEYCDMKLSSITPAIDAEQSQEMKLSARKELFSKLCTMLARDKNFNLLLELKMYVRDIGLMQLVREISSLASNPYRRQQQQPSLNSFEPTGGCFKDLL